MAISPSTSVSRTAQTSVAVPVEEAAVVNAPSTLDDPSSKVDSFHGPTGTVETGGVTFRVADGQVSTLDKDGTEVACGTCDDKGHYQITLDGPSLDLEVRAWNGNEFTTTSHRRYHHSPIGWVPVP